MQKKSKIKIFLDFLKSTCFKLNILIKNNLTISSLLVFIFFIFSFLLIYMELPVLSSGDDHYFHFRFAERFMQNGFLNSFSDFKTIYFTGIAHGEHFLYYNFLFYSVLILFTFITPLYLGIKLFAIISVSLIGVIFYYLFKKIDIKYPFLWAVGFFSVIGLGTFWRLFLSRPFVLSPLIMLLLILAIHKKKYFWIFLLSFMTLFWHTATFLVPLGVMAFYFFCYYFYQRKYLWKELLLVFLGTISSVLVVTLIDCGFFVSLRDNLFSVLSGVLNLSGKMPNIAEGNEVYPKNFFDLLNQNIFLCILFIASSVIYIYSFIKEIKQAVSLDGDTKSKKIIMMVFFILASVFIVAINFISNRFSDFFIFFSWVFVALVFNDMFSYIEFTKVNLKKIFGYAVFVCLLYLFVNNGLQLNDSFASSGSRPETFSQIGNYLSKNLKKGEVVFDLNWSWFPQLYYYAPDQNYAIGLEPKLTYLYSPRLYWLLVNIGNGYICENEKCPKEENERKISFNKRDLFKKWADLQGNKIANTIEGDFQSHYIVSSKNYGYLNNVLNNNKRFEKVVDSNGEYFVYKILPLTNAK